MHDSLTNRFRGGFWGIWLGETAVSQVNSPTQPAHQRPQLAWSLQTLAATDRWLAVEPSQPASSDLLMPQPDWLPVALLYHDQPQQMQQILRTADSSPEAETEANAAVGLVLGQTISLILRERFAAELLIPQVIRDLDLSLDLPLVQALLQAQSWLTQPADLAAVMQTLKAAEPADLTLAVSLYSFLSSPEHFQISLLRLCRIFQLFPSHLAADPALAGASLGAVSGIYNGLGGIPNDARIWPQPSSANDWQMKLSQRADWLLRQWSGVSANVNAEQWLEPPHASLIAAPRVIRAAAR